MLKPKNLQPEVSAALLEALDAVLFYLWDDERADYLDACQTGGPARRHHIFRKLELLRRWLDQAQKTCGSG